MCAGNLPSFCGTGVFAPAAPVAPVAPVVGVVAASETGATVEDVVTPWADETTGSATAAPTDNPATTSEVRSLPFTPLILPCEGATEIPCRLRDKPRAQRLHRNRKQERGHDDEPGGVNEDLHAVGTGRHAARDLDQVVERRYPRHDLYPPGELVEREEDPREQEHRGDPEREEVAVEVDLRDQRRERVADHREAEPTHEHERRNQDRPR